MDLLYAKRVGFKQPQEGTNEIDEKGWVWPDWDRGTWEGPRGDWLISHSKKWFKYPRKFDVCIQAGGAYGLYPRLLSDRFKMVYTFEPTPLSFYCLVQNCQKDNIVKTQAALGEKPDLIQVVVNNEFDAGLNMVTCSASATIPQLTIDSFGYKEVDLIALDTEQYEANILRGAEKTIDKFRPVIIIECGARRQETKDILASYRYTHVDSSIADDIFIPS